MEAQHTTLDSGHDHGREISVMYVLEDPPKLDWEGLPLKLTCSIIYFMKREKSCRRSALDLECSYGTRRSFTFLLDIEFLRSRT